MKHVPQFDQAWVDQASPTEIAAAARAGTLAAILGQPVPIDIAAAVTTGEQLTREDLETMKPQQINEAHKAGILDDILGIRR